LTKELNTPLLLPLFSSANKGAITKFVRMVSMGILNKFEIFKFVETRTHDQAHIQSEGMQLGAEQESKFMNEAIVLRPLSPSQITPLFQSWGFLLAQSPTTPTQKLYMSHFSFTSMLYAYSALHLIHTI
jgi:hypothetical protein